MPAHGATRRLKASAIRHRVNEPKSLMSILQRDFANSVVGFRTQSAPLDQDLA